jgi:hypothetical protein
MKLKKGWYFREKVRGEMSSSHTEGCVCKNLNTTKRLNFEDQWWCLRSENTWAASNRVPIPKRCRVNSISSSKSLNLFIKSNEISVSCMITRQLTERGEERKRITKIGRERENAAHVYSTPSGATRLDGVELADCSAKTSQCSNTICLTNMKKWEYCHDCN